MIEKHIRIVTWRGRHGVRAPANIDIDVSKWPRNSIVYEALINARNDSLLEAIQHDGLHKIKRGLQTISQKGRAFLKLSISEIDQPSLITFLENMDYFFSDIQHVQSTKFSYVTAIRALLKFAPDKLSDDESLRETLLEFVPRHRRPRRLRIEKLPDELGSLKHSNLRELEGKAKDSLQQKLQLVESAVAKTFDEYSELIKIQRNIVARVSITDEESENLKKWLLSGRRPERLLPPLPKDPKKLAGSILKVMATMDIPVSAKGWPICRYPVHRRLGGLPQTRQYLCHSSTSPWFLAAQRLPNLVITAIFIQICTHTAWNPASVSTLRNVDIKPDATGSGYLIQSYKGKTDDETPIVEIHPSSRVTHRAISLILWNHEQLKTLGVISASEERLWFGWGQNQNRQQDPVEKQKMYRFCKNAGIDKFSPSEIRPMRAAVTYLTQKDIEAVRVLLGHRHLAVTDVYLRDSIFFRLNEANILKFQRQIESGLVFLEGGQTLMSQLRLSREDIADPNFWPTGDGGICSTPRGAHPSQTPTPNSNCAGTLCHYQDGCPAHRIHVNAASIEVALRTQDFYKSRWGEIYNKNPVSFLKIHLPRLLFMRVLLDIVDDRRPDILHHAKKLLA